VAIHLSNSELIFFDITLGNSFTFTNFETQSTFNMQEQDYKKDLSEIRSMMESSSRFISLSGLSGVFAGIYALIGAYVAYDVVYSNYMQSGLRIRGDLGIDTMVFIALDMGIVLILTLATGIFFTTRKARKQGMKTWDKITVRLIINLMIPLIAGGLFCIPLIHPYGASGLVASATLIFYGLALINASKYTLRDIRYLGLSEIVLGLISAFLPGYGLIFWSIGFGVLHIVYGTVMYFKYER
jgi:hypothetical protein